MDRYHVDSAYWNVEKRGEYLAHTLFAHPRRIDDDPSSQRKHVCVIGAGIAGLVAGYELVKHGHRVTIFEASARCGGRIETRRFALDTYGEFGAMRIPADHACILHYIIDEFHLGTRPFVTSNGMGYRYLRGVRKRIRD